MEEVVRIWTLMFWIPPVASALAGSVALGRGIVARPLPLGLWFLTALLLQFLSGPWSVGWTVGMVAQSVLAISLCLRLQLGARAGA